MYFHYLITSHDPYVALSEAHPSCSLDAATLEAYSQYQCTMQMLCQLD
jgi:hypothetical protein